MKNFFDEVKLSSGKERELIDITDQVREAVMKSSVKDGIVVIFSQHTTGPVRISEYEPGLMGDYDNFFNKIAPKGDNYAHDTTNVDDRPNTHSHLQSITMNSSETIPIRNGEMMLGKWQTIFFVELDGPRAERKAIVQVIGE